MAQCCWDRNSRVLDPQNMTRKWRLCGHRVGTDPWLHGSLARMEKDQWEPPANSGAGPALPESKAMLLMVFWFIYKDLVTCTLTTLSHLSVSVLFPIPDEWCPPPLPLYSCLPSISACGLI